VSPNGASGAGKTADGATREWEFPFFSGSAETSCRPWTRRARRVHVIGGPGSGKTWLAARLGAALRCPIYELDMWPDIATISLEPTWVAEGVFLWGIAPLLERADVIVMLDLPYRVAARRIVTRHIWLSTLGRNRHRGLRLLARFAWGARRYYWAQYGRPPDGPTDWDALSRAQTNVVLGPFGDKVVRLHRRRQVVHWLRALG